MLCHALGCKFKLWWWQTLFWTQAQHLRFLHDSIWFLWFDTIFCLSNLSCELWNRKLTKFILRNVGNWPVSLMVMVKAVAVALTGGIQWMANTMLMSPNIHLQGTIMEKLETIVYDVKITRHLGFSLSIEMLTSPMSAFFLWYSSEWNIINKNVMRC